VMRATRLHRPAATCWLGSNVVANAVSRDQLTSGVP